MVLANVAAVPHTVGVWVDNGEEYFLGVEVPTPLDKYQDQVSGHFRIVW